MNFSSDWRKTITIEMKKCLIVDPLGRELELYIRRRKQIGLKKSEARLALGELMDDLYESMPESKEREQMIDSANDVLDYVMGNCPVSLYHIFPEED